MDSRPLGLVAFLFTDIEGSSRRWEEEPLAMSGQVESHDRIVVGAVESHRGEVFSTAGDSFAAVFATAGDAVGAALEAQQGLEEVLPVRMAVHAGPAQSRDGDWFGPTLNRAGRLRDAAHGGQVICSQAVVDLLADDRIAVDVIDLGEHRLKDLGRPERIYQLSGPGSERAFPELRTLRAELSNLPIQVTSFVGRHQELAEIDKLLLASRLVTLTGTAGSGKSRIALEMAAGVSDGYPDGVWLVELAPVEDSGLVPDALARVFRVPERSEVTPTDSVVTFLKRRRLLLVVDNCEHLLEPVARLVSAILSGTPEVSVLATSREPLHTAGETIYPLPPLPLPDLEANLLAIAHTDSVRLFVERAAAAQPGFHLAAGNAHSVASICRRLDGIPLALELAADNTRHLSVEDIDARLDDRFRLLRHGHGDPLPHHRSLEAAIDWSYQLLTAEQQTLLARLAVFEGGWTLEAAEQVCSGDDIDPGEVLPLLTDLVDRSMVVPEPTVSGMRYRLLESIKQYASARVAEHAGASAHALYYLHLAQKLDQALDTDRALDAFDHYAADIANLRTARRYFDTTGQTDQYCDLLAAVGSFLRFRRMWDELDEWLERAIEIMTDTCDPATRGRVLLLAGHNADRGQREHWERAVDFRQRAIPPLTNAGDGPHLIDAFAWLGREDPRYFDCALDLATRIDYPQGLAWTHHLLGVAAWERGEHQAALGHFEQALEAGPVTQLLGFVINWTGVVRASLGNNDQALDLFVQALEVFEQVQDPAGMKDALEQQSMHYLRGRDHEKALEAIRTSIAIKLDYQGGITPGSHALAAHASILGGDLDEVFRSLDEIRNIPGDSVWWRKQEEELIDHGFLAVVCLALQRQDAELAVNALAAEHIYRTTSLPPQKPNEEHALELAEQARALLSPDQFDSAWRQGLSLSLIDIINLAFDRYANSNEPTTKGPGAGG